MITHGGDSLHCGHYVSGVFDTNTGIWWHCDDDNITQICDSSKRGLYKRVKKKYKNDVKLNRCIICGFYQNQPDKI